MKATFDLPDDLYRSVKARSALEGRSLRSVAVELLQQWLSSSASPPDEAREDSLTEAELKKYPWLESARSYVRPGVSHDLEEIKEAIARGWGEEAAKKLRRGESGS